MDKEMEGGIHNTREVIWANSDVLQTNKLTCNFLDHNKWNPIGFHQHWKSGKFHWQCNYWDGRRRRIWQVGGRGCKEIGRELFVYETGEI